MYTEFPPRPPETSISTTSTPDGTVKDGAGTAMAGLALDATAGRSNDASHTNERRRAVDIESSRTATTKSLSMLQTFF
jgi:hypothetical protein